MDTAIIAAITALAGIVGGLGGALIMGWFHLRAQAHTQRNENVRNMQKIAYEAAIKEWLFIGESMRAREEKGVLGALPPIDLYILNHLGLARNLSDLDMLTAKGDRLIQMFADLQLQRDDAASFFARELKKRTRNDEGKQ
jgi:hypothetical protein